MDAVRQVWARAESGRKPEISFVGCLGLGNEGGWVVFQPAQIPNNGIISAVSVNLSCAYP
jgi:hypothetical protein